MMQSAEQIFKIINDYQQLKFSYCLKVILVDKKMTITSLYYKLLDENYYLTISTLYRYFNSNPQSNRFPPQEFIKKFVKIISLNPKQSKLLFKFYFYSKLSKKYFN